MHKNALKLCMQPLVNILPLGNKVDTQTSYIQRKETLGKIKKALLSKKKRNKRVWRMCLKCLPKDTPIHKNQEL